MVESVGDLSPEAKAIVAKVAVELAERPMIGDDALTSRIFPFHNTTLAIDVRMAQHRAVKAAAEYVRAIERMTKDGE